MPWQGHIPRVSEKDPAGRAADRSPGRRCCFLEQRTAQSTDPVHKDNDLGGTFDIQPELVELSGRNKSLPLGDEPGCQGRGTGRGGRGQKGSSRQTKTCLVSGAEASNLTHFLLCSIRNYLQECFSVQARHNGTCLVTPAPGGRDGGRGR